MPLRSKKRCKNHLFASTLSLEADAVYIFWLSAPLQPSFLHHNYFMSLTLLTFFCTQFLSVKQQWLHFLMHYCLFIYSTISKSKLMLIYNLLIIPVLLTFAIFSYYFSQGHKGIIVFQGCNFQVATGHVDLWDGSSCSGNCYFNECNDVRLFKL